MDYTVHSTPAKASPAPRRNQRIVPPRPKLGERQPRPYSSDDLDALFATAHSHNWLGLVTLNAPPACRITTADGLKKAIQAIKQTLTNWRRRHGFPCMLLVTEFDVYGEAQELCANFHIGLLEPLSGQQQKRFCDWWLKRHSLPDNKGRAFQHDAKGGGRNLQSYLSKDVNFRGSQKRYTKFPAPWLPPRTDFRLWFVIGDKRQPASLGAAQRALKGIRRSRYDTEHGKTANLPLTERTPTPESEHGHTYITAEPQAAATPAVHFSHSPEAPASPRRECPVCWVRHGRSLWENSCKCNQAFPYCRSPISS